MSRLLWIIPLGLEGGSRLLWVNPLWWDQVDGTKLDIIEGWVEIVGVRPGVSRGSSKLSEVDQVFHRQVVRPVFEVYEFPGDGLGQFLLKGPFISTRP